ncbi:helix-turn-helix domain-containing protein [Paucibacter sediminis]|uniref:helix-turn-helix domain-containing protein n=1 Tax=Paucibacter sediminis TaxID=3019553 RepID=UPI003CC87F45
MAGGPAGRRQRRLRRAFRAFLQAGLRRAAAPLPADAAHRARDTELPITEIAFQTGWESLGTFGRTFRDVTGESPSANRERGRAQRQQLDRVPHCIVSAAQRPGLVIAVSEKRRRAAGATNKPSK